MRRWDDEINSNELPISVPPLYAYPVLFFLRRSDEIQEAIKVGLVFFQILFQSLCLCQFIRNQAINGLLQILGQLLLVIDGPDIELFFSSHGPWVYQILLDKKSLQWQKVN